jgi:hypothetical protein
VHGINSFTSTGQKTNEQVLRSSNVAEVDYITAADIFRLQFDLRPPNTREANPTPTSSTDDGSGTAAAKILLELPAPLPRPKFAFHWS